MLHRLQEELLPIELHSAVSRFVFFNTLIYSILFLETNLEEGVAEIAHSVKSLAQ